MPNRTHLDRLAAQIETALGAFPPTGSLTVLAVPTDADTLVISDGTTSTTYTFLDATAGGSNEIIIGVGGTAVADTVTNIITAINLNAPDPGNLGIIARARGDDANVDLENTMVGVSGNVAITCDANPTTEIVVRGMWSHVELWANLLNNDQFTLYLGRNCHRITVYVDEAAACRIAFGGSASDTTGIPLDGSMLLQGLRFPEGIREIGVSTDDDQTASDIYVIAD